MSDLPRPQVAIVDYGMGNLFSVKHACEQAGMRATITTSRQEIRSADAVILPGVGAFGDAMHALEHLDLAGVLRDIAGTRKPLVGICLGMQLLMTVSYEFGRHQGLGIIAGEVVRLEDSVDGVRKLKVPQVGWNRIHQTTHSAWEQSLLKSVEDREFMYFVHSFYVKPGDSSLVLSMSKYGPVEFCSSLHRDNVFACQFHPERSGPSGIRIYQNLAAHITRSKIQETRQL